MSAKSQHTTKSYSFLYKIYRRLKYVRYRNKLVKNQKLEVELKERNERIQQIRDQKEFILSEKQRTRLREKVEAKERKRINKELKAEFRQSQKMAKLEWKELTTEEQKKRRELIKSVRNERKKLRRRRIKWAFRKFFISFKSLNIKTIQRKLKSFRENAPNRYRIYKVVLNSTVLFLLSYFALFFTSQAVTVIAARFYDYPATVYYYTTYFNISQEAWYHDSVKTIFSAGPVICFVIGITFLITYSKMKETTGSFKLFFLWGFLHSVNMLFGALLVGTLFEAGVGHVISWMYIMDTGRVLFSIISIFLLVITGLIVTKPFLISGNTYFNEINRHNRTSFMIAQVLIPFLISNLFLLLLRQPRFVFYDTFIGLTQVIIIIPILITFTSYNDLYFEEDEKNPRIAWISMGVLALALFIFRVVLEFGVRFSG